MNRSLAPLAGRRRRHLRSSASVTSASRVRAAASAIVETLELRRMLAINYSGETITAPGGGAGDRFGEFAATNSDGSLVVVTAPRADVDNEDDGIAHLYDGDGNFIDTFNNPDPSLGGQFGVSTAFVGNKLFISAGGDEIVYVYDLNDSDPLEHDDIITAPAGVTNFGSRMSSDGSDLFVAGATGAEDSVIIRFSVAGASDGVSNSTVEATYANPVGETVILNYLNPVWAVSDTHVFANGFDTDTSANVVIVFDKASAARENDEIVRPHASPWQLHGFDIDNFGVAMTTAPNGHVFVGDTDIVYELTAAGTVVREYTSPDFPTTVGEFGRGVQFFGGALAVNDQDQLIIGASETSMFESDVDADPDNDGTYGGEDQTVNGAVYIFDYATGDYVDTIFNPSPEFSGGDVDEFGRVIVALSDGKILINNPGDNNANGGDAGAAYIYSPVGAEPENTPPTNAQITGQANAVRNQAAAFSGTFEDPDAGDEHTIEWDFGDSATGSGADVTHAYTATGTYTVTMTVTDLAGDIATDTFVVTVAVAGEQGGTFYFDGNTTADTVSIKKNDTGGSTITVNGQPFTYTGSHVVIFGGNGADTITVSPSITVDVEIHGGADNDSIAGGSGNDIIVGGAGDDVLYGGAGRDLLIGGIGADGIVGEVADDILVAGTTSHDNDSDALADIMAEWTSGNAFQTRVDNLRAGLLDADFNVFNDASADTLTGKNGDDWFFVNNTDGGVQDVITDLKNDELTDDLDFVPVA